METKLSSSNPSLNSKQKEFLNKWCWTAFFFPPVWAFCNQLYIEGLTFFIPIYGIFVWIRLAHQGRTMAWERGTWISFEQFQNRESLAVKISIGLILLSWILDYAGTI